MTLNQIHVHAILATKVYHYPALFSNAMLSVIYILLRLTQSQTFAFVRLDFQLCKQTALLEFNIVREIALSPLLRIILQLTHALAMMVMQIKNFSELLLNAM